MYETSQQSNSNELTASESFLFRNPINIQPSPPPGEVIHTLISVSD